MIKLLALMKKNLALLWRGKGTLMLYLFIAVFLLFGFASFFNRSLVPFLIVGMLLPLAILLSSLLLIEEKTSKATFRNLTTPTPNIIFLFANYLSLFLIFLVPLGILLLASWYFFSLPLFSSFSLILLVIFLFFTLFVFIGMIVGYSFSSESSIIIVAFSLAAFFFFTSDQFLPLAMLPGPWNVVFSLHPLTLSKQMLEDIIERPMTFTFQGIGILALYSLVAFFVLMIAQHFRRQESLLTHSRKIRPKRRLKEELVRIVDKEKTLQHDQYLKLRDGKTVKHLEDLAFVVDQLDEANFKEYVTFTKNEFADWVKDVLDSSFVADEIRQREALDDLKRFLKGIARQHEDLVASKK